MAIFHMQVRVISRANGHSSTAAAAYRHGIKIEDHKTGEVFDYTRKSGVSGSIILLPAGADPRFSDPAFLWGKVEESEKRADAQVARELDIALPVELDNEQKKALAVDYCREHFTDKGMIADIAFHKLDSDNPHFHVMLTTRRLTPDGAGFSSKKERAWNDRDQLQEWRKGWADTANEHLANAGIDAKIDHRSLTDQKAELDALPAPTIEQQAQSIALDRAPTIHRGKHCSAERQERFDELQSEKVAQEATAKTFFENSQIKMPAERPAPTATPAPKSADDEGGYAELDLGAAKRALKGMAMSAIMQVPGVAIAKEFYDDATLKNFHRLEPTPTYTPDEKKPQQGAGGNAKQQKQGSNKPTTTQQPTLSSGDELDRKGMSKSQIEELEALDEVHAAQRKAAAETEKATAGFSSANIQQSVPQSEPEPSAPAASRGSFKDRLKMKKAEFAQKAETEEEAQDHERKRRRGLGLLH
ncbi:TPA: MobA/MobL family protein [Klebsiella pneumoniae]|nr:MobA/MobL family protein [Klebsiella pneumoniae]